MLNPFSYNVHDSKTLIPPSNCCKSFGHLLLFAQDKNIERGGVTHSNLIIRYHPLTLNRDSTKAIMTYVLLRQCHNVFSINSVFCILYFFCRLNLKNNHYMAKKRVHGDSKNLKNVFSFKLLLALLLLTTISYVSSLPPNPNVLADSPSFSRQEVRDDVRDGINVNGLAGTQKRDDYKDTLDNSTDIQKITYLSEGKNLNATLWLGGGNFMENGALEGAKALVYGMLIDVDSNPKTGFQGVDYQQEIQWTNSTNTWNLFLGEYRSVDDPSGKNPVDYLKILDIKQNHTGFFVDHEPYVTSSLPLEDLAFPNKFQVMYYAIVIYDYSNMLVDLGSWIDIPPPDVTISTLPNPVVIRQGEQENVAVQLKSNEGFISQVVKFLPINNYSKIDIEPNNITSEQLVAEPSLSNNGPTTFKIKAASDAAIGEYTIPVLANISTGAVFPSQFLKISNYTFSIPTKGNVLRVANLTMSVIEPITVQEHIKEFWATYGGLLSLVGAGFGGALATYVLDRIRNRKKEGR
jgi:hypothetical protein